MADTVDYDRPAEAMTNVVGVYIGSITYQEPLTLTAGDGAITTAGLLLLANGPGPSAIKQSVYTCEGEGEYFDSTAAVINYHNSVLDCLNVLDFGPSSLHFRGIAGQMIGTVLHWEGSEWSLGCVLECHFDGTHEWAVPGWIAGVDLLLTG